MLCKGNSFVKVTWWNKDISKILKLKLIFEVLIRFHIFIITWYYCSRPFASKETVNALTMSNSIRGDMWQFQKISSKRPWQLSIGVVNRQHRLRLTSSLRSNRNDNRLCGLASSDWPNLRNLPDWLPVCKNHCHLSVRVCYVLILSAV